MNHYKSLFALLVSLSIVSCKKEQGCTGPLALNYSKSAEEDDGSCQYMPFQGPHNPDFEETDNLYWKVVQGPLSYAEFTTGTGFMPTSGYNFMKMTSETSNNWASSSVQLYQENIDVSFSDTMIFDYSIDARITTGCIQCLPRPINSQIEFKFTGNGTQIIWSKDLLTENESYTKQKLNEKIALPDNLPDQGKLTIEVRVTDGAFCDFRIDNFRVK